MDELLPLLKRLAEGIAALLGPSCEVTIHDLSHGFENSIIAIINGEVTGRRVGDGASEVILQALKESEQNMVEDEYSYIAHTKDGRILKCCSIFIHDNEGKIIGLFGVNFDVSEVMMAQSLLGGILKVTDEPEETEEVHITTNVNDLLDQYINESNRLIGKPVAMMNKDDKVKAIQYLNNKGAFLIKKAGDKISKYYDISKYTLYNYLDSGNQEE